MKRLMLCLVVLGLFLASISVAQAGEIRARTGDDVKKAVSKDFGVDIFYLEVQYRFTAWVWWRDGSYCVIFSDENPTLLNHAVGLRVAGYAAGIQFTNGRAFGGRHIHVQKEQSKEPRIGCGRQDGSPWLFDIQRNP